jgi:AraC family transcriptional regulator
MPNYNQETIDKADQQSIPQQTSTLAFEQYVSSRPILSSVDLGWQNLIVRTYTEPQTVEHLVVPATPDPHLVLQLSGTTHVEVKAKDGAWAAIRSQPGQLFLTPGGGESYEMRWVSQSDAPIQNVQIHLDAQYLAKIGQETVDLDSSQIEVLDRSAVCDPFIEQICLMLKRELEQNNLGSKLYAEAATQMLAVHLLREHCVINHRIPEYKGGLPGNRLRRVKDYIQTYLDTDLSLDDLAQQAQMSTYHFCRLFKQSTGESPNQYIVRLRVEEAKRLLKETNFSVLEVALAVGYNSPSHLAVQFKRLMGMSPSAYRNTI